MKHVHLTYWIRIALRYNPEPVLFTQDKQGRKWGNENDI